MSYRPNYIPGRGDEGTLSRLSLTGANSVLVADLRHFVDGAGASQGCQLPDT
jgi:hypothetical protein